MKDLLFRNRLILYVGVSLRYFLLKVIRRRNVDFQSLLHGIKCPKDKENENFNISNEFTNRLYAITFFEENELNERIIVFYFILYLSSCIWLLYVIGKFRYFR